MGNDEEDEAADIVNNNTIHTPLHREEQTRASEASTTRPIQEGSTTASDKLLDEYANRRSENMDLDLGNISDNSTGQGGGGEWKGQPSVTSPAHHRHRDC